MKPWHWGLIGIGTGVLAGVVCFAVVFTNGAAGGPPQSIEGSVAESVASALVSGATSTVIAPTPPVEPETAESVTLLFLGDVMLDRNVRTRMSRSKVENYPFAQIAKDGFFDKSDLVIANLEGPVTKTRRPPEKTIDFAFNPSVVALLKRVGIDAVSQANNHALDQGRAGAEESRMLLTQGGLVVFGDQTKDEAAYSLAFVERPGGQAVEAARVGSEGTSDRIALLGFNDSDRPVDRAKAGTAIAEAKTKAGTVIVNVHWGAEYQAKPNARQTSLAHWFIDQGVDAVIGGHPHWMQSVEVYKNRPIAYSLGNFVFDQDWSAETREGLAIELVLTEGSAKLVFHPLHIEKSEPKLLTGTARAARLKRLAEISDPGLSTGITAGMIEVRR